MRELCISILNDACSYRGDVIGVCMSNACFYIADIYSQIPFESSIHVGLVLICFTTIFFFYFILQKKNNLVAFKTAIKSRQVRLIRKC